MIRLVVCIDSDADTLYDAYADVYKAMSDAGGLDWESSDEWFDSDGELGDPEELSRVRMRFFDSLDN